MSGGMEGRVKETVYFIIIEDTVDSRRYVSTALQLHLQVIFLLSLLEGLVSK